MPKAINTTQNLVLDLIRRSSFNFFDGKKVVSRLIKHSDLWEAVVMTDLQNLICLRDMEHDIFHGNNLYILPAEGRHDELLNVLKNLKADEARWIGGMEACNLLGSWSPEQEANTRQILSLWWD